MGVVEEAFDLGPVGFELGTVGAVGPGAQVGEGMLKLWLTLGLL